MRREQGHQDRKTVKVCRSLTVMGMVDAFEMGLRYNSVCLFQGYISVGIDLVVSFKNITLICNKLSLSHWVSLHWYCSQPTFFFTLTEEGGNKFIIQKCGSCNLAEVNTSNSWIQACFRPNKKESKIFEYLSGYSVLTLARKFGSSTNVFWKLSCWNKLLDQSIYHLEVYLIMDD